MKAVMLSIQPKYCELIASEEKTIEVRKSHPSIETPFKCYIYCAKHKYYHLYDLRKISNGTLNFSVVEHNKTSLVADGFLNGKVIGEFVCDYKDEYKYSIANYGGLDIDCQQLDDTCLTKQQIEEYANGQDIYGWHISDLVIYDKPRELGEFKRWNKSFKNDRLTCPPQSWGYVEANWREIWKD